MRRLIISLATGVFCAAAPGTALAQTCAGSSSFSASPVHAALDLTLADNASGLHLALGVGGRVAFGGVAVAALRQTNAEAPAKGLVFFGGAEFGGGRVFVCPLADLEFMSGPNVGAVEISGVAFAGGGRVGVVAKDGALRVIPTFGYFRSRQELTATTGLSKQTTTQTFGLLQLGVGFVSEHVGFGPTIEVPVGLPGASSQLRIGVGFYF